MIDGYSAETIITNRIEKRLDELETNDELDEERIDTMTLGDIFANWLDESGVPKRCPICGNLPKVKYLPAWKVWEISCRPLFRHAHFVYTGEPYQSKRETITDYNRYRRKQKCPRSCQRPWKML